MGKIQRAPCPEDANLCPAGKMLLSFISREGYGEILSLEEQSGVSRYPFMVGFSVPVGLRPVYLPLLARKGFGLNVPDASMADVVARCEALHGTPGDKFKALGLTARRALMIETLLIDECPVVMELRLRHYWPVGEYDFIVGELVLAHTDADILERRRLIDWQQTPLLRPVEEKHV